MSGSTTFADVSTCVSGSYESTPGAFGSASGTCASTRTCDGLGSVSEISDVRTQVDADEVADSVTARADRSHAGVSAAGIPHARRTVLRRLIEKLSRQQSTTSAPDDLAMNISTQQHQLINQESTTTTSTSDESAIDNNNVNF